MGYNPPDDNDDHSTSWVAITPYQSRTFQSEEEAIDWIAAIWRNQPRTEKIKLMRVERYTSIIYRPASHTHHNRRKD